MDRPRRLARLAVACAVVVLALTELVPSASAAPAVVRGLSVRWSPATVTVARGGAVRWRSVSGFHDVHAYGSNWAFGATLPAGTSVRHRFPRRGTFRFRCTLHSSLVGGVCSGMCGQVRVS